MLPVSAAGFERQCRDIRGQPQAVEAAVPRAGLQPRQTPPGLYFSEDIHTRGGRRSDDKLCVENGHLLQGLHLGNLDVHGRKGGSTLLEDTHLSQKNIVDCVSVAGIFTFTSLTRPLAK